MVGHLDGVTLEREKVAVLDDVAYERSEVVRGQQPVDIAVEREEVEQILGFVHIDEPAGPEVAVSRRTFKDSRRC